MLGKAAIAAVATVAVSLLRATGGHSVENCQVKIDQKTGVLLASAKAAKCQLADP